MQALKARLLKWWRGHGTKYLGTVTAFLGSVQAAITAGWLELDKLERQLVAWALIILGSATVKRGFTNSKNAE